MADLICANLSVWRLLMVSHGNGGGLFMAIWVVGQAGDAIVMVEANV